MTHRAESDDCAARIGTDALQPLNKGPSYSAMAEIRVNTEAEEGETAGSDMVVNYTHNPPFQHRNEALQIQGNSGSLLERDVGWPVHVPKIFGSEAIDFSHFELVVRSPFADHW